MEGGEGRGEMAGQGEMGREEGEREEGEDGEGEDWGEGEGEREG